MNDDERLVHLKNMRVFIDQEIARITKKQKNAKRPSGNHHRLTYSGLFVQTSCLVPFIQSYLNEGKSALSLADAANVSPSTVTNIMKGKNRWTREEVAESIMLALNLPHEYRDFALVRIQRKYQIEVEPPFTHYEEE